MPTICLYPKIYLVFRWMWHTVSTKYNIRALTKQKESLNSSVFSVRIATEGVGNFWCIMHIQKNPYSPLHGRFLFCTPPPPPPSTQEIPVSYQLHTRYFVLFCGNNRNLPNNQRFLLHTFFAIPLCPAPIWNQCPDGVGGVGGRGWME